MTQATDTDIKDLRDLIAKIDTKIDNNTSAISLLRDELRSFREETRISATKLEGKLEKLDERTKLGFWGFILRGVVLTAIVGAGGYLLPIVAEYIHKLPSL